MITGYRIPGDRDGQAFTLPDWCWGLVGEADADEIAQRLRREAGREPAWQSVRGRLIQRAKARRAT